jgi:hypothetical protein
MEKARQDFLSKALSKKDARRNDSLRMPNEFAVYRTGEAAGGQAHGRPDSVGLVANVPPARRAAATRKSRL